MLLPKCPSCHSHIPLSEVFSFSVVCPVCHNELVPNRWSGGLWVLVISAWPDLARYLGLHWVVSPAWTVPMVAGSIVGYLAINLLALVVLLRYRVKDSPLSIIAKTEH
jgi:RNA polymerase subunit RPABC4/transcription elongation factor Spt4